MNLQMLGRLGHNAFEMISKKANIIPITGIT